MKFLLFLMLFSLSFTGFAKKQKYKWHVSENIKTPESVYYAAELGLIFVSNIDGEGTKKDGKGHISLLSKSGKVLNSNWVSGLNAPKGMRFSKGMLWVSDIDELVEINISNGKIVKRYPISGARFLNDIAIAKNGDVFVSDTITSKIHILRDGEISTFVEGDKYESPNGLLVIGDDLYVAPWGLTTDWSTKVLGRLYKISLTSKELTFISKKPLGHLDGLEIDKSGNFLVSDWSAGLVYRINPDGKTTVIFKGNKGLADIGWIQASETLLIPYMNDNEILGV